MLSCQGRFPVVLSLSSRLCGRDFPLVNVIVSLACKPFHLAWFLDRSLLMIGIETFFNRYIITRVLSIFINWRRQALFVFLYCMKLRRGKAYPQLEVGGRIGISFFFPQSANQRIS